MEFGSCAQMMSDGDLLYLSVSMGGRGLWAAYHSFLGLFISSHVIVVMESDDM